MQAQALLVSLGLISLFLCCGVLHFGGRSRTFPGISVLGLGSLGVCARAEAGKHPF